MNDAPTTMGIPANHGVSVAFCAGVVGVVKAQAFDLKTNLIKACGLGLVFPPVTPAQWRNHEEKFAFKLDVDCQPLDSQRNNGNSTKQLSRQHGTRKSVFSDELRTVS